MDSKLKLIIDVVGVHRLDMRITYDSLYEVFRHDFNPEKLETPQDQLERWLKWASVVYNFSYELDVDHSYYFWPL